MLSRFGGQNPNLKYHNLAIFLASWLIFKINWLCMPDDFKSDFYFLRTIQFNVNFTHNYIWCPYFYSLFGILSLPGVNSKPSSSAVLFCSTYRFFFKFESNKWNEIKNTPKLFNFGLNTVNYMNKIVIHYIPFVRRSILLCGKCDSFFFQW